MGIMRSSLGAQIQREIAECDQPAPLARYASPRFAMQDAFPHINSDSNRPGPSDYSRGPLHRITIDGDFITLGLLLEGFGEHEVTHPVDPLVTTLDGEVVRLASRSVKQALLLRGGNELKAERGGIDSFLLFAVDLQRFERCTKLV